MLRLVVLRLLESYFRHRWLYLLPIVLMAGVATVYTIQSPRMYISSGVLFVQKDSLLSTLVPIGNSGFSWITPAQMTANELNELLRTEAFIRFIIQRTSLEEHMNEGPEEVERIIFSVRQSIWVGAEGEKLMRFGARHQDPDIAYQLASSTIEAYTDWKLNADRRDSMVAQAFFASQLEPLQQELEAARTRLSDFIQAHPAPIRGERPEVEQMELDGLQAMVDQLSARVKETLDKEEAARLALSKAESEASQSYLVIDAPTLPREPSSSKKDLIMSFAIFIMIGVALTGGGIVGGMLLDRSIRFPVDVQHSLDLPVLAMVPNARPIVLASTVTNERKATAEDRDPVHKPGTHAVNKQSRTTREPVERDAVEQPAPLPTS